MEFDGHFIENLILCRSTYQLRLLQFSRHAGLCMRWDQSYSSPWPGPKRKGKANTRSLVICIIFKSLSLITGISGLCYWAASNFCRLCCLYDRLHVLTSPGEVIKGAGSVQTDIRWFNIREREVNRNLRNEGHAHNKLSLFPARCFLFAKCLNWTNLHGVNICRSLTVASVA